MIIDKILTALHVLFSNLVTEIFKPSRHVEVYHTFFHLITMKKDIIKNFLFEFVRSELIILQLKCRTCTTEYIVLVVIFVI